MQEERTIEGRFEKLQEEIQEVFAPLSEKGVEHMSLEEKRAVAEELVDVIIISLGCIDSLGFDFENMFFKEDRKKLGKI